MKLWKQILLSVVLGMVLPGLLLRAAVGAVKPRPPEKTEIPPETSVMTLPPQSSTVRIQLRDTAGGIRDMDLEQYLCGVVTAEMPASFEPEALKAQAVVARTYTLRQKQTCSKHGDGSVCTDPACCQGYLSEQAYLDRGGSRADYEKICRAVAATAGLVLTYQGELIESTYFSCSGGQTEDAAAVWGNDIPYLQSTVSPGEEAAAFYTDTRSFTGAELEEKLGVSLSDSPDQWLRDIAYTKGGGVAELYAGGQRFSGPELRARLGLPSTAFTVIPGENSLTFNTRGYGHRVGMSQYGADAMAVAGCGFEEILTHYYRDTRLIRYDGVDKIPGTG